MITAQILGKTELDGIFKVMVEDDEIYYRLSEEDKEILLSGFAANICYTEKDMEEIVSKGTMRNLKNDEKNNEVARIFVENGVEKFVTDRNITKTVINDNGVKKIHLTAIELGLDRADNCFESGHHSVADHKRYAIYFTGLPKLLAMVLNNEKDYATSEKSARYTKMSVTKEEEEVYHKWIDILKVKILDKYPSMDNAKAEKLAQENARYMISVYTPTKMLYSASLRQLNYITVWLKDSLKNENPLYKKLAPYTQELISALERLPIEQVKLQANEKNRGLSLIEEDNFVPEQFGNFYALNYKGSFAQLAQAHRHRTIDYSLSLLEKFECYIPKIIRNDESLVKVWKHDIEKLAGNYPQGMLVQFFEGGKIEDFVLKTKERLCGYAQLEICDQTKESLGRMISGYKKMHFSAEYRADCYGGTNNRKERDYYAKIEKKLEDINKGARCTQPDYTCQKPCGNKEAITLDRDI